MLYSTDAHCEEEEEEEERVPSIHPFFFCFVFGSHEMDGRTSRTETTMMNECLPAHVCVDGV